MTISNAVCCLDSFRKFVLIYVFVQFIIVFIINIFYQKNPYEHIFQSVAVQGSGSVPDGALRRHGALGLQVEHVCPLVQILWATRRKTQGLRNTASRDKKVHQQLQNCNCTQASYQKYPKPTKPKRITWRNVLLLIEGTMPGLAQTQPVPHPQSPRCLGHSKHARDH